MKRVEKVLAGFEDNADVVSGCLKDLPPSAWGKETAAAGVVGGGRRLPPGRRRQVLKAAANTRMHCPRNQIRPSKRVHGAAVK